MNLVVATIKSWNIERAERLRRRYPDHSTTLITDKAQLTAAHLAALRPRYVFFPHWSWIIPSAVYDQYECIVFHMTDLPYGRGGSPLQNLIVRGHTTTKISAIRVGAGLDTGPVYLKHTLSLEGTAAEILTRASEIVFSNMIPFMIENMPQPEEQIGDVVEFRRRTPEDGNIRDVRDTRTLYNVIRMLDGEGYPPAFLEDGCVKVEFSNAKEDGDSIVAMARISIRVPKL